MEFLPPKDQTLLLCHSHLMSEMKQAQAILLRGEKGIGKATLAWHFIKASTSYINDCFVIDNKGQGQLDQVRAGIRFFNMQSNNKRFLLIDTALNQDSYNALLKTIEEPMGNKCVIIVQHNAVPMTISSRMYCIFIKPLSKELMLEHITAPSWVYEFSNGSPGKVQRLLEEFKSFDNIGPAIFAYDTYMIKDCELWFELLTWKILKIAMQYKYHLYNILEEAFKMLRYPHDMKIVLRFLINNIRELNLV